MMKQGLIDPKKTELLVDFDSTGDFTKIVELTAIPFPTSSWTPADVTALDDMAKRVADAGVIENGVVEIRGLMISGSEQQNQIFVINRIKSCLCYKIVLSDPLHTTIEFYAFITNWSPSNTVGDKARVAFNLTIDGDVKFYNDNGMIWDGSSGGVDPEPLPHTFESSVYNTDFVSIEPDSAEIDPALVEITMRQINDIEVTKTLEQWLLDYPNNFFANFESGKYIYSIQIGGSDNNAIWKHVLITSTQPFSANVIGS